MAKLKIDKEFRSLIPPLKPEELEALESNLRIDGCREPLVTWRGIILDGHNRYEICERNKLFYDTVQYDLADRDEALLWIINNQLGRRNLEAIDKVPLVERSRVILEKQAREREYAGTKNPSKNFYEGRVNDNLGDKIGVSGPTYDALRTVSTEGTPELIDAVRTKVVGASTAAVIAELPEDEQREVVAQGKKAMAKRAKEIRDSIPKVHDGTWDKSAYEKYKPTEESKNLRSDESTDLLWAKRAYNTLTKKDKTLFIEWLKTKGVLK